jgi:hypothetical protein
MPDPIPPTDDEVVRLVQAGVEPLRHRAPPPELRDELMGLVRSHRRQARVGRLAGTVAVIASIALVAGIATAVHVGLHAGSGPARGRPAPASASASSQSATWQAVALPSGFSATGGIACLGPDDCLLLGSSDGGNASAIWRYSGGAWASVPFSGPAYLQALTCVAPDDCWAVGSHVTVPPGLNDGVTQPIIEHSDGAGFSVVSAPQVPGDADGLDGVACISADECWAAGSYAANSENGGDGIVHPFAEHYDDSAWTVLTSPGPVVYYAGTGAVACTGSDACWGFAEMAGSGPLDQFDGATWVTGPQSSSNPDLSGDALGAAICLSPTDCWAVGATAAPSTSTSPLEAPVIAEYAGAGWEVASSPAVQGGPNGAVLSGIACSSADDCWAVGTIQEAAWDLVGTPPPNTAPPLIEHWDGSAWTLVGGLPVDSGGGGLIDVTCVPSSSDCYAVGPDLFYSLTGG